MSSVNPPQAAFASAPLPVETQTERRVKYGLMVALTIVIAIAIAAIVTYLAQRSPKRVDTTAAGMYSLKPQTVNLIKENKQKISITSLYTKQKPGEQRASADSPLADVADQAEKVADLLEEYRSKGQNIEIENIDPISSPSKVDDLIEKVTLQYGGEVTKYQKFVGTGQTKPGEANPPTYEAAYKRIKELADPEIDKITKLPMAEIKSEELQDTVGLALFSVRDLPTKLKESQLKIRQILKDKPPRYKVAADSIKENMEKFSGLLGDIIQDFTKYKQTPAVPEVIRKYMTDSLPTYQEMKTVADGLITTANGLGELKLDTLYDALHQKNPILVRGETEWKVLSYDQVWKADNRDVKALMREGAQIRPRFAGEQMITTAILALDHPKKLMVAFVRAGGMPVSQPGFPPFQPNGPFSAVAERLREYNYDVVDKDLTGMYAMQQQQQQNMSAPEPSDADIKDAIWVVMDEQAQPSQFGPAPTISTKVAEHLANGGSALFVVAPRGDDMTIALKDWGIQIHPDTICVHEAISTEAAAQGDMIEEAQKVPFIFQIRDWGDHLLTAPLRSLTGILIAAVPVNAIPTKGVTATPLIPIPAAPSATPSWGEKDFESLDSGKPTFDAAKGDLPGPLFAGVAAEKQGAGRVVVLGSYQLPESRIVDWPDQDLLKRGIRAARFPGNAEIFTNSIYWLSHQEPMIAISPAAMDVSRIGEMSKASQGFWRIGVLLIGLPGAVILAGALVWFARRD